MHRLVETYGPAFCQLILLYGLTGCFLYYRNFVYVDDAVEEVWWATCLRSFGVITLPTTVLIFLGMTVPPLPVQVDRITDVTTPIVIRWTTRGIYPQLVNHVVQKTYENLKNHAALLRFEIVTETHVVNWGCESIPMQEMVIPRDYQTPNRSAFKARALHFGAQNSLSAAEAYILHLDEESIVTENLYFGVRQFISESPKYIGQGIITYANVNTNPQSYFCHLADAMRTGDDFARFRFQCLLGHVLVGMKGSFMVIPNQIEHEIGFDHGPHSSITEDAWFAMVNYDKVRFCRGILEEQSPFTIREIMQRRRWASGLWKLVWYHPVAWWRKTFLTMQMVAWVLSPLVALSLISSFLLTRYRMPDYLSIMLTFNFVMFNVQYWWGCMYLIHRTWYGKVTAMVVMPFCLPLFLFLEGVGGLYGSFSPVSDFQLVQKESETHVGSEIHQ